jgi:hypothetical protein
MQVFVTFYLVGVWAHPHEHKRDSLNIVTKGLKGDFEVQMNRVHKLVPMATAEEDKNAQSYKLLKEHLPLITCSCGTQILLVPDLRAMNLAIKAHAAEHRKKGRKFVGKK